VIRIRKPKRAPKVLHTHGKRKTQELQTEVKRARQGGVEIVLHFDPAVYAHRDVKTALSKAQHGKCAFCESKILHISHGDVEHFRPKKGFRQHANEPLSTPGYYWLTYAWINLYFCCQICNQRHKKSLFPLADASARARSPRNVAREKPLFIDPSLDDPSAHITFHGEFAVAINGSPRGAATIDGLQLNRRELVEERRQWLDAMRFLLKFRADLEDWRRPEDREELERLRRYLAGAAADQSEYAAMARALLSTRVH
jgi:uncharacterized protein (TIGR02646 family)